MHKLTIVFSRSREKAVNQMYDVLSDGQMLLVPYAIINIRIVDALAEAYQLDLRQHPYLDFLRTMPKSL